METLLQGELEVTVHIWFLWWFMVSPKLHMLPFFPHSRELLEVEVNDEALKLKLHGFVTNANYSTKKMGFLLFINHRLVDSSGIV